MAMRKKRNGGPQAMLPLLLLLAASSCDAFVAPSFVMPMGRMRRAAAVSPRLQSPALAQFAWQQSAIPRLARDAASAVVGIRVHVRSNQGFRARSLTLTACQGGGALLLEPSWGGCGGGGGRGGGPWWKRHNLGQADHSDPNGDRDMQRNRRCRRAVQGLVAVRGAESWLSAEGGRLSRLRCPAVNALLCVNAAVYLLQVLTQGWLLTAGAKINPMIVSGQYYRVSLAACLWQFLVVVCLLAAQSGEESDACDPLPARHTNVPARWNSPPALQFALAKRRGTHGGSVVRHGKDGHDIRVGGHRRQLLFVLFQPSSHECGGVWGHLWLGRRARRVSAPPQRPVRRTERPVRQRKRERDTHRHRLDSEHSSCTYEPALAAV